MNLQHSLDKFRSAAMKQLRSSLNRALESVGLELLHKGGVVSLPVLSAFGVGLLVGGGAGLLMAPMPGSELRARLMALAGIGGKSSAEVPDHGVEVPDTHSAGPSEPKVARAAGPGTNSHVHIRRPGEPVTPV